jgi:hypothetical protein
MLVHERQYDDLILFDHVEERIPKPAEDRPPDFTFDLLIQLRVRPQMRFGPFEVFYER